MVMNLDGVLELQTSTACRGSHSCLRLSASSQILIPFTQFYIEMNDSKATVESLLERRGRVVVGIRC